MCFPRTAGTQAGMFFEAVSLVDPAVYPRAEMPPSGSLCHSYPLSASSLVTRLLPLKAHKHLLFFDPQTQSLLRLDLHLLHLHST